MIRSSGEQCSPLLLAETPRRITCRGIARENLKLLTEYIQQAERTQSLLNRLFLLWASTKVPDLLSAKQQKSLSMRFLAIDRKMAAGARRPWWLQPGSEGTERR